ncbi:ATP-dependent RNA helicase DEAH12, chloroplastic [Caerostris darwini]|uniref:ATP-dependent RNA helicase DEAH12, chloroplastic n=1 Tax=Caerostris darwini TaxID=1538125 RepID=A0AAV4TZS5_9ARAC|nr:ATP-dependent RNA helicase DEAH12, chloroplastic [Caerostris darwini]
MDDQNRSKNAAVFNQSTKSYGPSQGSSSDDKSCANSLRNSSRNKDFQETIRYQDRDSYESQRHHYIGNGLYNTDDIQDLPPRHRQKVLNVVQGVVSYFSSKYPEDFDESKNPEIRDILDLNKKTNAESKPKSSCIKQKPNSDNTLDTNDNGSNPNKKFAKQNFSHDKYNSTRNREQSSSNSRHNFKSDGIIHSDREKNKSSSTFTDLKHSNEKLHKNPKPHLTFDQANDFHRHSSIVQTNQSAVKQRDFTNKNTNLNHKYTRDNHTEPSIPRERSVSKNFSELDKEKMNSQIIDKPARNDNTTCKNNSFVNKGNKNDSTGPIREERHFQEKDKCKTEDYVPRVTLNKQWKRSRKKEKEPTESTNEKNTIHNNENSNYYHKTKDVSPCSNKQQKEITKDKNSNSSTKYANMSDRSVSEFPSKLERTSGKSSANFKNSNRQSDCHKELKQCSKYEQSSLKNNRETINYSSNCSNLNPEEIKVQNKQFQQKKSSKFSSSNKHCDKTTSDWSLEEPCKTNPKTQDKNNSNDSCSVISNSSNSSSTRIRKFHQSSNSEKDFKLSVRSNDSDERSLIRENTKTVLEFSNASESRHYHITPKNIKKTKESGFFIHINVSENADNLEFWEQFLKNILKHKHFILQYCCKFSESLVLNFEKKSDALNAVPILRKLKNATKNLREPHIILVSNFKTHIIKPCDCSGTMFENCNKYFEEFKQRFIKEHKNKIFDIRDEMKTLYKIKDKKMQCELKSSLNEKLNVLERMLFVYVDYVKILEKKLYLHEKIAMEGNLTLKEKAVLQDEQIFEFSNEERSAFKELLILDQKFEEGKISMEEKRKLECNLNSKVKLPSYSVYLALCKLKKMFSYECSSFQRCLPVYSKKDELLKLIQSYSVLVINAETGSGKTTQLAEYLLQSWIADRGTIICTQPRKIAAISVTKFVCGQIGSSVGKLVGYDVGTDKKYDSNTKIIYMTDYVLLKKLLRNKKLRGVSCVIVDEAHERTLYTDLVLGMLKNCLHERLDLRLIITSATMDPYLFVHHFGKNQTKIIDVPGRTYPVEVIWLNKDVEIVDDYVEECVKTALNIHHDEPKGDILVFLTSPGEIDEAIIKFKDWCKESEMPQLISLHGKSDLQEQLLVFETSLNNVRKIIFATNAAETSLTIPGVKYVVDSGMAKEMTYFPHKNKSCLVVGFVNKSSAEQRKGRAGRTQPGVCYRMYSKKNFHEDMPDSSTPEILKTNLQKALLKLYQFGIEPTQFDFVESPKEEAVVRSLESLEFLGLIQENERKQFCLTQLGKKVVELPLEPRLAKLVLEGIQAKIGYETIIMAAVVNEAGRLFFRQEEIKEKADKRKKLFCQEKGDLCTYLEVFKRWMEEAKEDRYKWCVQNFINSKALNSAARTIQEVLKSIHQELGIRIGRRYNNIAFESQYEKIIFNCFSENLCTFSGHPKMGYYSPYFTESLFIHPSSSLSYLKTELPTFLVYSTLMETSRNFLMDVTPIKEEILKRAYVEGTFKLQVDMLKSLQILPKVLGPFGETVLINYILGKKGSKILDLEMLVEKHVKSRNFKIDVRVDKGIIVIYLEKRYHETVSHFINDMVEKAHVSMSNEEEMIKIKNSSSHFCLGGGGLISDIIMPGEFKEVVVDNLLKLQSKSMIQSLEKFGPVQSLNIADIGKNSCRISATYTKVVSAQKAMLHLSQNKRLKVKASVTIPVNNDEALPFYKMQVSWCRCPSTGKGWIEFTSEADCIMASSKLTLSSFYMDENYIRFSPYKNKILDMSNLPSFAEENKIRKKLHELLPGIKDISVHVMRKKMPPISEKDVENAKSELKKLFCASSLIDLKYPDSSSIFWTASVYFKNWKDGIKSLQGLEGKAKINSVPLEIKVLKESHLQCKKEIYDVIKNEIFVIEKKSKSARFSINLKHKDSVVHIGFSCKSMQELFDVHYDLSQLLQGEIINCFEPKYQHLLTAAAHKEIINIEDKTQTAVIIDNIRKLISVFGPKKNRIKAFTEICSIVLDNIPSKKRRINLKDSNIPHGFLKSLYSKYGLELNGLIRTYCLKNAKVDTVAGKLIIEGTQSNLDKVEEHLEKICLNELCNQNFDKNNDEDADICSICLDFLVYGFSFRLENCGHAFCKTCLVLQIESKSIPLTCIKQDCGKKFFLTDIKKLLAPCSEDIIAEFYAASLNYHVNQNLDKVFYCPSPDCHNVYRVSSIGGEQLCVDCGNVICLRCKSLYHYGMSCEIFQNSEKDEDYSIKVWMQEDKALRKQCPYCQAVIEKESGCNHMECFNCRKHLCWLCLEIFPTSQEVYDHQPYCPNNQGA